MDGFVKAVNQTPPSFTAIGKLVATSPFVHSDKINNEYVLMMGIEGSMSLRVEDIVVELRPRELLIIPPGCHHVGARPSEKLAYYWCHFSLNGSQQHIPLADIWDICTRMHAQKAEQQEQTLLLPLRFSPIHPSRLMVLLQQLLDVSKRNYHSQGVLTGLVCALLYEVTEQTINSYTSKRAVKESMRFSEIAEWVRINAYRHITVNDVANRFKYNPNYISGLFRSKTGYSLLQFIVNTKMDVAKELLVTTDMTIKEIATQLAYNDPRYFMRCFKNHQALTPSEYRNTHTGTMMNTRWLPYLIRER